MQSRDLTRIPRSLEIPVSLEYNTWSNTAEKLTDYLYELKTVMEAMKHRAEKLDSVAEKALKQTDCASSFIYHLVEISMTLKYRGNVSHILIERLSEVLGSGVRVGELHIDLAGICEDDPDQDRSQEALAKLLSGILIRPFNPIQQELPCFPNLKIDCNDSALWQFEALCSALSVSHAPIRKLSLSGVCKYHESRGKYWKLVAQTFFRTSSSSGSFSSVRGLEISDVDLTLDDLAEITAVLQEKEHQALIAQQWDICQTCWLVRKSTLLQFRKRDGDNSNRVADTSVKLAYHSLVELVLSETEDTADDSQNDWLDVIIPACGQCRVPRESVVAVSTTKAANTRKSVGEPMISLSLSFNSSLMEPKGVEGLLKQIGWSLRKLSLSFHREVDVNVMVPQILKSCPNTVKLTLNESYIDLDRFSIEYEGAGTADDDGLPVISTLRFQDYYGIGEGEGVLFMKRLGDPTTRLAKHLRDLTIHAEEYAEPLPHTTLTELWIELGKNKTLQKVEVMVSQTLLSAIWKRRLRRFNGQVLPPHPLPLSCKLAFLSVANLDNSGDIKSLPALQRLDRPVLSLVFEFAANRVVRSIKVYG